ncbi:MAG: hypothetical protein H5T68_04720 [Chloroflexi bacterium]|nr:hypothetical protein [Chloroflexota bacterium]
MKQDIQQILQAIDKANASLAINLPITQVAIYRAGFSAAMQAVATAFGVVLDSQPAQSALESHAIDIETTR